MEVSSSAVLACPQPLLHVHACPDTLVNCSKFTNNGCCAAWCYVVVSEGCAAAANGYVCATECAAPQNQVQMCVSHMSAASMDTKVQQDRTLQAVRVDTRAACSLTSWAVCWEGGCAAGSSCSTSFQGGRPCCDHISVCPAGCKCAAELGQRESTQRLQNTLRPAVG